MRVPGSDLVAESLEAVLERSRALGFLGPGPIAEQQAHAEAFLQAIEMAGVELALDLGSGGGVPGLVLATLLPQVRWTLLDGMQRRTTFLAEAVTALDLEDRVEVVTARAEEAGRRPALRGGFQLVVARGFAPPAVTAECAAPLLADHGQLVVSEPPESLGARWPGIELAAVGLTLETVVPGPPSFVRLRRTGEVPERFPRRVGVPGKRPLWS
ncbi:MAG: rRNA small subunit methyltransferase [Actinomycetia bacterium]|nr:rRNA small subunit methyltransferase [Actinomycetes bacterium]